MPLRTRLLLASGAGVGGGLAVAFAVGPQLQASTGYPWNSATAFAVMMAV